MKNRNNKNNPPGKVYRLEDYLDVSTMQTMRKNEIVEAQSRGKKADAYIWYDEQWQDIDNFLKKQGNKHKHKAKEYRATRNDTEDSSFYEDVGGFRRRRSARRLGRSHRRRRSVRR